MKKTRLGMFEKTAYGAAGFGGGLTRNMLALYLLFYYADVVGLNPAYVSLAVMFGNIWDPQFNRLMGATDLWYLRKFLDERILYYNAGTTVNSDHKSYKERYPHFIVESFMYGRVQ